jgi:RNA polymerase subunit RPABC4/transcription elongation factor Spt4
MSRPDEALVTLQTGPEVAERLLDELFARPRRAVFEWSRITGQTAQVRLAYPGQHLASVITGVPGSGTAARGVDLADGSEVKSCSRADQLGSCRDCGSGVLPHQELCPACGSESLIRKTDSHWIFSIKSKQELAQYLDAPRIVLILFDRDVSDPAAVRVRAWEVWPRDPRHEYFRWFALDYLENNYLAKTSEGLAPAPLNLHPLKFDFLMMNPVLVFGATIKDADTDSSTVHVEWIADPLRDRATLPVEPMPAAVVRPGALLDLAGRMDDPAVTRSSEGKVSVKEAARLRATAAGRVSIARGLVSLDEKTRLLLPRPIKRIKRTPSAYRRRRASTEEG